MENSTNELITWFEIPASDFNKSVAFYESLWGVQASVQTFNGKRYGIFTDKQKSINGSVIETEQDTSGGPVLFFRLRSEDISSVLYRVEERGGKVIQPRTLIRNSIGGTAAIIPKNMIDNQVGYYGMFLDPHGNKMAVYANH